MLADQPVIVYPKRGGGQTKMTAEKAKAISDAWEAKRKKRGYSLKGHKVGFGKDGVSAKTDKEKEDTGNGDVAGKQG